MKNKMMISILLFVSTHTGFSQSYSFYYYDKPTVLNSRFTNSTPSEENGFNKVLITPGNVVKFNQVAPANIRKVYSNLNNITSALRKSADQLTAISNKTITNIDVQMVNDAQGLLMVNENEKFFCRKYNSASKVFFAWPCASNNSSNGFIRFGEVAAGRGDIESVFIHELSHTQTLKDAAGFNSRYGQSIYYVDIAYGGDAGHYKNELQGDQQLPMDEALGNFWGGIHNPAWPRAALLTFNNNQKFLLGSHSELTGTSEMWDADHTILVSDKVPQIATGEKHPVFRSGGYELTLVSKNLIPGQSRYEARLYNFCDLLGKYTFNSELMTELYLNMFHKYAFANKDSALSKISDYVKYYAQSSQYQKHRYPHNMAVFLSASMEDYYKSRSAVSPSGQTFVSSIFPLALYDLLMHFGLSDTELKRQFDIATYNMDGVPELPKAAALSGYFTVRNSLKDQLMEALYNGKDCKDASTKLDLELAISELRTFCMKPSSLELMN